MKNRIITLLFILLIAVNAYGHEYLCSFEKKTEVMKDFFPEEQSKDSENSSKELIKIIGNPVSVKVGETDLIYKVKVSSKENIMHFAIIEADNQSIIGWNKRQKFSTRLSLEDQSMVFTELISGNHVAVYFYSCRDSLE